jgi:MFS family permease
VVDPAHAVKPSPDHSTAVTPAASPRPARRLRRDLRASTWDAGAFSIMVGLGETYVPAFVLALGHGPVLAGLVATLPMLAGAVLQLASPRIVRALGSHRRWVVFCVAAQGLSLLPLALGAFRGRMSAAAVFGVMSLYFAFGQGAGPAWNSWMEQLVPARIRPRWFATRNRVAQAAMMVGLVAGGYVLEGGVAGGHVLTAFAIAFVLAAVARGASSYALSWQGEPPGRNEAREVPVGAFARRLWRGQDGRLVLYLVVVQTAVFVASPFFNPYMLGELRFSYTAYVGLVATAFLARIAALPLLGRWADRYGARRLLWVGGVGIMPMSLLWVFSHDYRYLIVAQILSGITWGAYDLATQLLFFELIRREERTSVLTWYNLVNAVAVVVGSLAGGAILAELGGARGYAAIFTVSFVGRLGALFLLRRVAVTPRRVRRFWARLLPFGLGEGVTLPVTTAVRDQAPASHASARASDRGPARR